MTTTENKTLTVMATRANLSQTTLDYIASLARRYGCAPDDVLYYRDGYPSGGWSVRVNKPEGLEALASYSNEHFVGMPA